MSKYKLLQMGFREMVITDKDGKLAEMAKELAEKGLVVKLSSGYTIDVWELTDAGRAALGAEE